MVTAARWMDKLALPDVALRRVLVVRALADVGIEETAANSSGYIDEILLDADAKPGDPWCAAAVNRWCKDAGAARPPRWQASCDTWMTWAKSRGTWEAPAYKAQPGDLVVYGVPGDAQHIGVVGRVTARGARSIEGNTSFAGVSREGIACDYKPVDTKRVIGYIRCNAA